MDRRFEIGVIIGHMELSVKEDCIKEIEELKNAIIEGKEFEVARIIGHIEMKSSDQYILEELSRLWNIMLSKCVDLDGSIAQLNLSVRTYNCLIRAKITTIRKLSQLTKEKLRKIRNFTLKSIEEVCVKMANIGIEIKD